MWHILCRAARVGPGTDLHGMAGTSPGTSRSVLFLFRTMVISLRNRASFKRTASARQGRAGRPSSWRQNSITPAHDGRRESQRTLGEAVRSRKVSGRYRRMPERSIWPVPRDALPKPAAEQIGGYGSSSPLRSLPRSVMARLTTLKVAGGAERRSGRRLTVFARRGRSSFCPLFAVTASREGGGGCRVIV